MHFSSRTNHSLATTGFTLVEVLIIAPIVILAIGGFVGLLIAMTSDVLITRDQNNMTYETQDALDQIEQDVRLSTQFLVTSGTFTAPQGSDSNFTGTAAFTNSNNTLILGSLTTDKNPSDSTRQITYYAGQPNLCGAQQVYNRVFLAKVMYFIKNGSLWKRSVLPNYNTNATLDDDTVCSAPWQRNTCSPGYSPSTRCQTNDSEVMKNIDTFNIKYYDNPKSTTEIASSLALAATTIEVTINGKKVTAGRDITGSGSIRATKLNNIDVDLPIPGVPDVSAQVNGSSSVTFSWSKVPLASSYIISYNINGGSWINATNNSQTTTYNVTASLGDTITIRVAARNSSGTSANGTALATIPMWYSCGLQNSWVDYGFTYSTNAYTKTNSDVVMLKGLVKSGNATSGTVLCTLPVGYRPSARLIFAMSTSAVPEGVSARVDVLPTGEVVIVTGNNAWLSLDGIRFVASTASYTWTTVSAFQSSWTNYGFGYANLQSTLDSSGRTHVQGLVKDGVYTNPTTIALLPAAHRPATYMHIPANSNAAFNYVAFGSGPDAKGINPNGWYSIQAMFYPAAFTTWTDLTPLGSGWVAFGAGHPTPQYTRSADKIVTLKGLIKNGNAATGTVIANLPAGYRPKERILSSCVANGGYCRIDILPNGNLEIRAAHAAWTSLDAISFLAEQ